MARNCVQSGFDSPSKQLFALFRIFPEKIHVIDARGKHTVVLGAYTFLMSHEQKRLSLSTFLRNRAQIIVFFQSPFLSYGKPNFASNLFSLVVL